MSLHDQQRETSLDKRRGHRPRLAAPGTGRRPVLTLADRLLATTLHQRLALPQVAIAVLFSILASRTPAASATARIPPVPATWPGPHQQPAAPAHQMRDDHLTLRDQHCGNPP